MICSLIHQDARRIIHLTSTKTKEMVDHHDAHDGQDAEQFMATKCVPRQIGNCVRIGVASLHCDAKRIHVEISLGKTL